MFVVNCLILMEAIDFGSLTSNRSSSISGEESLIDRGSTDIFTPQQLKSVVGSAFNANYSEEEFIYERLFLISQFTTRWTMQRRRATPRNS